MTSFDDHFDVAVIGAGPSGALASYHLSKAGLSVLLIEKESLPRYKTCGGGLVYRARKLVPALKDDIIDRECFEINWGIKNDNIHFRVERPYPILSMVMRDKLDKHIVDSAVKEGTTLMDRTTLKSIETNGLMTLDTSRGKFNSKMIIGADGALGITARLAGFNDGRYLIPALEAEVKVSADVFPNYEKTVRFDVGAVDQGYGWVFPKRKHLSIGIASEKRGNIGLKSVYNKYIELLGLDNILSEEIHGFQIPIKTREQFSGRGVLLTGDAAGLADPLVAEGISHALISGKLAAEAVIQGNLKWTNVENIYNLKLKKEIVAQTNTGRLLSQLFYRYPRLRKYVLNRKGERLTEYFTDVFSGIRRYPQGYSEVLGSIGKTFL